MSLIIAPLERGLKVHANSSNESSDKGKNVCWPSFNMLFIVVILQHNLWLCRECEQGSR